MNIFKIVSVVAVSIALAGCTVGAASYGADAPEALDLTPDEVLIWANLTAEQRAHAIIYIENGGTLVSSLGAL